MCRCSINERQPPTVPPTDKPGPPASVKITKVFADRVKLRWEPPHADGGSEITNYIIEKRETSRANWALVTSNIHGHITDCSVEKLIEGHEYQFRVSAENQYGVGDPIMTDPVMVKNPYGEFRREQQRLTFFLILKYCPTFCWWSLQFDWIVCHQPCFKHAEHFVSG